MTAGYLPYTIEIMNSPNFLVIGAQKNGTTSPCSLLGEHPEIYICDRNQPHYIALNEAYARGWDWYTSLFEDARDAKVINKGSTGYKDR